MPLIMLINGKPRRLIKTPTEIILYIDNSLCTIAQNGIAKDIHLEMAQHKNLIDVRVYLKKLYKFDIPPLNELLDVHIYTNIKYILTYSNGTFYIYRSSTLLYGVDNITSYCLYDGCMYYAKTNIYCYRMWDKKLIKVNMDQSVDIISYNGKIVFFDKKQIFIADLDKENSGEKFNIDNKGNKIKNKNLESNDADNTKEKNESKKIHTKNSEKDVDGNIGSDIGSNVCSEDYSENIFSLSNIKVVPICGTRNTDMKKLYTTEHYIFSICSYKILGYNTSTNQNDFFYYYKDEFVDIKDDKNYIYLLSNIELIVFDQATKRKTEYMILNKDIKYTGNYCIENQKNTRHNITFLNGRAENKIYDLIPDNRRKFVLVARYFSKHEKGQCINVVKDDYTLYFITNNKFLCKFWLLRKYEDCFVSNNDCFFIININEMKHYKIKKHMIFYYNSPSIYIKNISAIIYKTLYLHVENVDTIRESCKYDRYYIRSGSKVTVCYNSGTFDTEYDDVVDMCSCGDDVLIAHDYEILLIDNDKITKYSHEDKIIQITACSSYVFILTSKGVKNSHKNYVIYGCFYKFHVTNDFIIVVSANKISFYNHGYVLVKFVEIDYKVQSIASSSLVVDENNIFRII